MGKRLIAFNIESEHIKSVDDVVKGINEFREKAAEQQKITFLRPPLYKDENKHMDDLKVVKTEEMKFLPLSIEYNLTPREYLEFLRRERRINLSIYEWIISSIPKEKLTEKIPVHYDFIIYEGSDIKVVVDEKSLSIISSGLKKALGKYDKKFMYIDDIDDFILWIFFKFYSKNNIDSLSINDITFQSREEPGPTSKKHSHKGANLPFSDEILLGIAKAELEIIQAAKVRVGYNSSELEFYIEGRNQITLFNPTIKGYKLKKEELEFYNPSYYKKIKATYELIYKILPTLVSAYKNERTSWPREVFVQKARTELIKRLQEGFTS